MIYIYIYIYTCLQSLPSCINNCLCKDNIKANYYIEIFNILSERVFFAKNLSSEQTEIQLKNQSSGVYFLKVMINGKIIAKKFIVR